MFFVGIDVSKFKHDCIILNDIGKTVTDSFTVHNNAIGFATLLNALSSFSKENLKIGFEATGHYGCNLKSFLQKNGYSFVEINPLLIHNFAKQNSLRRTKTDSGDAKTIARFLMKDDSLCANIAPYDISELKTLCRFRFSLKNQRKILLLRMNNVLDKIFPEFYPLFKNKLSATALFILSHYGSVQSIANLSTRSYEVIRQVSKNTFSLPDFIRLKQLAKDSVGIHSETLEYELKTVLSLIADISEKIEDLEKMITKIVTEINPPTLSIVGVGPLSAACIISEYEDIKRFSSSNAMLSFAGLEPSVFQSGAFAASSAHMVKHGSSYLRYAIVNCCRTLRLHNEVFASYYLKKINEGKSFNTALIHLAKKLIRLIFALESKGESFDPTKQR